MRLGKKPKYKACICDAKQLKNVQKVMVHASFSSGQNQEQWGKKVA